MATLRIEVPRAFRPLLAPARYKGAHGGRGAAKSHFFAELLLLRCMQATTRAVCVREVQRSLEQSVKRLLEDKIQHHGLGGYFRVLKTHIETPGGGIIIFQGMQNHTAGSIKSLEGYDIAWVEEAQALSQRSLELLRPTIRKDQVGDGLGSEIWFSWNPQEPTDPVDAFLRGDPPPPDAAVVQVTWRDNPWLPDTLRRELEWDLTRDPAKASHVWGGEYRKRSTSLVFRNWRVEDFETAEDATFYLGGDWGFSVDPAVLVRSYIQGRNLFVDQEAFAVGCETDFLPFLFGGTADPELQRLNAAAWSSIPVEYRQWRGVDGARDWPLTVDSARPETISYMQRHGFPRMQPARKGAGSVAEGIEFLQSYDIVVHPRCRHAIDELATYSHKVDRQTGRVLPTFEDKKNHVIDSLRYAVEDARSVGGAWGWAADYMRDRRDAGGQEAT